MDLLDKIKASLGISGAEVSILTTAATVAIGDPVTGQVELVGGSADQTVTELTVTVIKRLTQAVNPDAGPVESAFDDVAAVPLPESPLEGNCPLDLAVDEKEEADSEELTVATEILDAGFTLHQGEHKCYDFAIGLGDHAEPSREGVQWLLFARVDIPMAVDATCWRTIELAAAE